MKNERILYTSCPLCDAPSIHEYFVADWTFHTRWRDPLNGLIVWMICDGCKHIFTNGYFTEDALEVVFDTPQPAVTVGVDIEGSRKVSAPMVDKAVRQIGLPNGRTWLDVGFGNGSLLMTAKEYGFSPFGVDLRETCTEALGKFGIPAHCGTIESVIAQGAVPVKPTVISMADVIEHVPYPLEVLRSARRLIDDKGVLFVSMPNAGAPLWEHWNSARINPYWYEIEHYHNFTRERLYDALEETGFRPVDYGISWRYRCCMEVLARPA